MPLSKQTIVRLDRDKPPEFIPVESTVEVTEGQIETMKIVGETITAYVNATKELLNGQYSHLREFVPLHLKSPRSIVICCSDDAVVVRYERQKSEPPKVDLLWTSSPLPESIGFISQKLIRCRLPGTPEEVLPGQGMPLVFFVQNRATGEQVNALNFRMVADCLLVAPDKLPQPPKKPYCLISARSTFIFNLTVLLPENESGPQTISGTVPFQLEASWDCIEVFPFFSRDFWKPENAAVWAEIDILAAATSAHQVTKKAIVLDPYAAIRAEYLELFQTFRTLLDSNPEREETLHQFLNENPKLLCPSHAKKWSKLRFGAQVSDFVFREGTGEYLLVEIERSTHRLFTNNGNPTSELTHATSQITDWIRYIQDNLSTVRNELKLDGITSTPQSLVVIGRSDGLTAENRRKLQAMNSVSPTCRILTYDEVYTFSKTVVENILGPLDAGLGNTVCINNATM